VRSPLLPGGKVQSLRSAGSVQRKGKCRVAGRDSGDCDVELIKAGIGGCESVIFEAGWSAADVQEERKRKRIELLHELTRRAIRRHWSKADTIKRDGFARFGGTGGKPGYGSRGEDVGSIRMEGDNVLGIPDIKPWSRQEARGGRVDVHSVLGGAVGAGKDQLLGPAWGVGWNQGVDLRGADVIDKRALTADGDAGAVKGGGSSVAVEQISFRRRGSHRDQPARDR
jgi:hypothetical protein